MFKDYYLQELQFLSELGEEFSRAHPGEAHLLAGASRDPDVERLMEGFAFLAGRVRQKLDDEFPELLHGVMNLLSPHYLRPVPAMAILEFSPLLQALRQSQRIARGTDVDSVPVEGTPCRFRTAYDVLLNPVSLEQVTLETRASGLPVLSLDFRIWNKVRPEALELDPLRLFLHGDAATTTALYSHLCRHVEECRVGPLNPGGGAAAAHRRLTLEPVGFSDEEALLPYPASSFPGYRLLQEYFALPEKFLFIDLRGLAGLAQLGVDDRFRIEICFDRQLPANLRPTRDQIHLYCTPIANLFAHEGDPIRIDQTQTEYRLRPSGRDPFHYEVFTVDRVTSFASGAVEEREIPPFYFFGNGTEGEDAVTYTVRLRNSVADDRLDVYVAFADARGGPALPDTETVAFQLTCSNRRRAEALRPGDIHVPTDSSPPFVQFRNLTAPTPSVVPPLDGDLHWRLLSHLSLNYLPLVSVAALRGVLQLYNFQALRDPRAARANALRLEGIQEVRSTASERLSRGAMLRGTAITVELLEDHFAGDGDVFLFSALLNELFGLSGTLNSFTQLTVHGVERGETIAWPSRIGRDRL
jgi:type VI secretion system protein ImpG